MGEESSVTIDGAKVLTCICTGFVLHYLAHGQTPVDAALFSTSLLAKLVPRIQAFVVRTTGMICKPVPTGIKVMIEI